MLGCLEATVLAEEQGEEEKDTEVEVGCCRR